MATNRIVDITVIIPTFNRVKTFQSTLNSFLSHDTIPSEIIVVDQSDDGGKNISNICKNSNLRTSCKISYIFSHTKSLTSARNLGLEKASNDIIIMSDDDVEIYNSTLDSVINTFKDETISMIACDSVSNKKREGVLGYFVGFKNFFKRKTAYVTKSVFGRYPISKIQKSDAEWAMGFFFCFRKSVCDKGNIFWDEELFSYCYAEDLDFSYRFYQYSKTINLRVVFDRTIKVNHLVSQEYRIPTKSKILMLILNRKYLSYKFGFSKLSRFSLGVTNTLMMVKAFFRKENYRDYYDAIKLSRLITSKNYKTFREFVEGNLND